MDGEGLHQLLRGRKVFDLGVELFPGMPHVPLHSPFKSQCQNPNDQPENFPVGIWSLVICHRFR